MSIEADALALKERFASLLRPAPPYRDPSQAKACAAIDAARIRLRGGEDEPGAAQLKLGDDQ